MHRKSSKRLTTEEYRKIVLDKGTFERQAYGCWVRANPDIWSTIKEEVPPHMECTDFKGYSNSLYGEHRPWRWRTPGNHPMVEKGIAFWLTENTLITGYSLNNNMAVYLPVFQPSKEKLNFKLRDEIRKYAKFIVADKRQKLYQKTLMNIQELEILPLSIIIMISHFTYDPFSYLKL